MSSVSNGLYFLTLPLVSVMHVICRKILHARYLYIKRNVEKVWGAHYTLGARYLSKNTVFCGSILLASVALYSAAPRAGLAGHPCPNIFSILLSHLI